VALNAVSNPVTIPNLTNVAEIAIGAHHACVMKTSGALGCWGANSSGQLGIGTTTNSATVQYASAQVSKLAMGDDFGCAISGSVRCWGNNASGQVGDGTTTNRPWPEWLGLTGMVSIAAGSAHACAVRGDGIVKCWGNNGYGQLGDDTFTNRNRPTQVPGITDAAEVVASANTTCVRHKDGSVSCWGLGSTGPLGDGAGDFSRPTPKKVLDLSGVLKLAAGHDNMYALLQDRRLFCWGSDEYGQCGAGSFGTRFTPVPSVIQ
jgi:alpha-tubulin suppressor-like RCC1 family protein